MRTLLATLFLFTAAPTWTLTQGSGAPAAMADLVAAMHTADVVFIGEQHNDAAGHQFEAALLEETLKSAGNRPVALSLEMFERDVQPVLDEYLAGIIREQDFLAASRPWPNYKSDYRPLIELARTHKIPVIAANAPGRYANRAARLGIASVWGLPTAERQWLAPGPIPPASPAYSAKFKRFLGDAGDHAHGTPHMFDGQVLRDATMAYAIATHLQAHPGTLVLHVNGAFHSANGLGTPEYLAHYAPLSRRLTVTMNPDAEAPGSNDFVVKTKN